MSLVKRLGRSERVRRALSRLIAGYIRLVWATNRWTVEGGVHADRLHDARQPYIGAFWHGRLLMMTYRQPPTMRLAMLQSPHRDGRIMAGAINLLGIETIWGSSNRSASQALRQMVRALRDRHCIAITPDGPDGPAMTVSAGIIQLARLTGAPAIPVTYATSRRIILGSWDRFHLALPFGRGIFIIDEPIPVPPDTNPAQTEMLRAQLETRLRSITTEADRRMGHRGLAPGTLSRDAFRARRRAAAGPG
jgi:hypothetical protein